MRGHTIFRVSLVIRHEGDWADLAGKYGVKAVSLYFQSNPFTNTNFEVFRLDSHDEEKLRHFLREFRRHENIKRLLYVRRLREGMWEIGFLGDYMKSARRVLIEEIGMALRSVTVAEGNEYFTGYSVKKVTRRELEGHLSEVGEVVTMNMERVNGISNRHVKFLTPLERQILTSALRMGFFDYPRRCSLGELSSRFGVTKTTANFHIRRAISKVLEGYLSEEEAS